MNYVIKFNNKTDNFVMNGFSEPFLYPHLEFIAAQEYVYDDYLSESHLLAILADNGIKVDLLEEDGSPLDY